MNYLTGLKYGEVNRLLQFKEDAMALDFQIKELIKLYDSLGWVEYNKDTSVKVIRKRMKEFTKNASKNLDSKLKEIKDYTFETEHGPVRVRAFYPQTNTYARPIVYLRGCGFVVDNFEDSDELCSQIASLCQTPLFSIDYPLAPENPYPIPLDACYQTLMKLIQKASFFDIESRGFVLMGESSGACLAACLSQMLRDQHGPGIGYLVLIYPLTDSNFESESYESMGKGYILSEEKMRWYLSKYFKNPSDMSEKYALPMNADDFSNLPKTLVVTAHYDPLRSDGRAYADQLLQAGGDCEYLCYQELIHGFLKCTGVTNAKKALLDIIGRINLFLKDS